MTTVTGMIMAMGLITSMAAMIKRNLEVELPATWADRELWQSCTTTTAFPVISDRGNFCQRLAGYATGRNYSMAMKQGKWYPR